eukprot:1144812-Pelagomonas_calceolata.AAC.2
MPAELESAQLYSRGNPAFTGFLAAACSQRPRADNSGVVLVCSFNQENSKCPSSCAPVEQLGCGSRFAASNQLPWHARRPARSQGWLGTARTGSS